MRHFPTGIVLLGLLSSTGWPAERVHVDLDYVRSLAQERAASAFRERKNRLPGWLRDLDYAQYQDIRFSPERSLWADDGLPFQAQFFHRGAGFQLPVKLWEYTDSFAQEIPFVSDFFTYGPSLKSGRLSRKLGYAGFRIHHPLNRPGYYDELIVFLGASYFRALGMGQSYGLSARGLALNTGMPVAEEFPSFVEFWLGKPGKDATSIQIYALMDSASVTGAFAFEVIPGETTSVLVRASLFMRRDVELFGVAPLTSMFWFGENSRRPGDDFRPEVHDSDGLAIRMAGNRWLWRPLNNPPSVQATVFSVDELSGFGLLQRDRLFDHYQDFVADFHLRPSLWVEPIGDWGKGSVRLVELPTGNEYQDNIVAFWVPEVFPRPGERFDCEYRLHWALDRGISVPVGRVAGTRTGHLPGEGLARLFVVDFEGSHLAGLSADSPMSAVIGVPEGVRLLHSEVKKNPDNDTWRVSFGVEVNEAGGALDLHCYLRLGFDPMTETWVYRWHP